MGDFYEIAPVGSIQGEQKHENCNNDAMHFRPRYLGKKISDNNMQCRNILVTTYNHHKNLLWTLEKKQIILLRGT